MKRRVLILVIPLVFLAAYFFLPGKKVELPRIPASVPASEVKHKPRMQESLPDLPTENNESEREVSPTQHLYGRDKVQLASLHAMVPSNYQEKTKKLKTLLKGSTDSLQNWGIKYPVLGSLRALPEQMYRLSDGEEFDRKGKYVIFTKPAGDVSKGAMPVVYNERTGNLGVVTGAFKVTLKDPGMRGSITDQYRLHLIQTFDHLDLAFYQSEADELSELKELYALLKSDPRIHQVDFHIIERTATPR